MKAARLPAAPVELLQEILDRGPDLQRQDRNRRTALEHAIWSGKLLCRRGEAGADVNRIPLDYGFRHSPLLRLLMCEPKEETLALVRLVLEKGADPNAREPTAEPPWKLPSRTSGRILSSCFCFLFILLPHKIGPGRLNRL